MLRAFRFLLFSVIGSVVGGELSAPVGQGPFVSRDEFCQLDVGCEAVVGVVECISNVTSSDPSSRDDGLGFVRESMLVRVGCSSISGNHLDTTHTSQSPDKTLKLASTLTHH